MKLFIFITVSFLASLSFALDGIYKLEVERNGITHLQVAGNFWQGEYPGPVIDIQSKVKGTTTIQGWSSLRKLNERKSCTVKNSLYHPWAESNPTLLQNNSVINYYTIAPVTDYKVVKPLSPEVLASLDAGGESLQIQPGDKFVNVFYLSEGISTATLIQGKKKTEIYLSWDALELAPESFELVLKTEALDEVKYEDGTIEKRNEQWLYLACAEGYNVFVQDKDLLSQKGIKEGTTTGYGDIQGAE